MRYCRRKDDIHQPGTEQRYFTGDGSREDNTAPVPIFWVKEVAYAGVRSSEFEVRGLEFGVRSSRFGVRQAAINRSRPRPRKRCSPFPVHRSGFGVDTPTRRYADTALIWLQLRRARSSLPLWLIPSHLHRKAGMLPIQVVSSASNIVIPKIFAAQSPPWDVKSNATDTKPPK